MVAALFPAAGNNNSPSHFVFFQNKNKKSEIPCMCAYVYRIEYGDRIRGRKGVREKTLKTIEDLKVHNKVTGK